MAKGFIPLHPESLKSVASQLETPIFSNLWGWGSLRAKHGGKIMREQSGQERDLEVSLGTACMTREERKGREYG